MSKEKPLEELIREKYPFPISHAYTYLESRVDPGDRYQALLTCFEVTLKTIASIALANFVRDIQDDPELGDVHLFQDLVDTLSRPLSLGHWHDLLRLTLRPYHTRRESLIAPPLFNYYYHVTEHGNLRTRSQNVRIIQRCIEERNEEAHHRNRSQSSAVQRELALNELEGKLEALLGELRFLADYPLLYVEHAEHQEGQWRYRANFAQGSSYPFRQSAWTTSLAVNSHRCLLLDRTQPAALELDPFVILTWEGRLQQPDIFFFDGVFSSGRANFMSYHVGDHVEPTDESSPASVASDEVNSLLELFRNRIPPPREDKDAAEEHLPLIEVYREAVQWSREHGERQSISLGALRQILNLSQEEALKQERELETERGVEIEPEVEVPFEGEPSWANVAYYVLDHSGQEEMYYRDIAAEAEELKDQHDPDWEIGDSSSVEATISQILSRDPRFYKLRRGYYRLTKHNELLSNPSWANLAYFVLQRHDPKRRGMQLQEITERAIALKEEHSDWRAESAQTPSNTVSTTMSMDHRFEAMRKRGYWRLAAEAVQPRPGPAVAKRPSPPTRDQAYEALLARLREFGAVEPLSFGRTYYVLEQRIHLMLRFSKAHRRSGEIEYFLGVTPQYYERIRSLGNGFLLFVLGSADNVLLVPAEVFAGWVKDLEPSGSGTWPMAFYQSPDKMNIERWVPGQGREDATAFRNDYTSVERTLAQPPVSKPRRGRGTIRIADLLQAGLLKPGDVVYIRRCPDLRASVVDAKFVAYEGRQWRYIEWGMEVTGWKAINVYVECVLARTGQTLDELRRELKSGFSE